MPDPKIQKYFEEHSHKYTDDALVSQLRQAGFSDSEIQEALKTAVPTPKPPVKLTYFGKIIYGVSSKPKEFYFRRFVILTLLTFFSASQAILAWTIAIPLFFWSGVAYYHFVNRYQSDTKSNIIMALALVIIGFYLFSFIIPGVCLSLLPNDIFNP